MEYLPQLVIVAVLIAALILLLQPRYAFVIRIAKDGLRTTKGKVPAALAQQIQESCERCGVTSGSVFGIRRGRRVILSFSRQIPADCQQQIRNAWALYS
ncbi:MAG TPA: DUF3634 family protein [Gemmataceae bacterium]|nr:DUF3634 family protein [Gemmataceae bacterium]